ncbi:PQQ-dependent sugar dehydrogenase [Cellulomonas chengniuliangii]|uniref:PQQ-dependent sugar dehydrogenase n=1 Tax=Cellulomonas chengniuliangii TaxID=2968084 RepID=A0ABY5L1W1_9CELL|nr:PQQ-dependent sugar dehydrogenase [Cellulomonas chengniuliangii]MCC2307156.1 PQQ-dependent sugar dehydrogenase [Cellulomonas chengniuliangii]MCC2317947.1 PQQ-dependent sugar dehydrogenase [Cellulomonas chengniuliangii]UUI76048.1 PQQ-dependent sugar dehydrogenase [Cellulomonas chengniuliangii]
MGRREAGPSRRRMLPRLCGAVLAVALAGCGAGTGTSESAGGSTVTETASSAPGPATPVEVTGVVEVASDLETPWAMGLLPDGRLVVTQRDAGTIVLVGADGEVVEATGTGAEELRELTHAQGEGGLLGVAVGPTGEHLFLYVTTGRDNRVVRAALDGTALGPLDTVLDGIPAARNHDGGRLAFGPDGFLYVATGDAGQRDDAPDPASLAGKILRVTKDGDPAPGNPDPASPVWSSGHRNVEGLGWATDGRMFASEFGQDAWDELNVIVPGGDYGWPAHEGDPGADEGTVAPVVTWTTREASPSGLAVTEDAVYVAALRGERLWRAPLTEDGVGEPQALLEGEHGRLRAVEVAPDGTLWVLTGNTDGRGDARPGDDRLLRVTLAPVAG